MKLIMLFITLFTAAAASASDRFPRPEFQGGYQIPVNDLGGARELFLYYVDVMMLLAALCAASYFIFKKRSRKGVVGVALLSVGYFGFYKSGCVCSIGAIQNITASLFSDYTVSITIFLIFVLPLIFALFFGRIFCSGVCPMGALQDIFAFRAKRVPLRISAVLGFIPYVYLGVTVLFAATGGGFPVCKLDPFVGIFRMSAPTGMLIWGAGLLAVGVFVARPYCRFLCPYGVILRWMSYISKYKVNICPDKCVNCRLCEGVCPVDAIRPPSIDPVKEPRGKSVKRLKIYFALIPVWIGAFAAAGWFSSDVIATSHPDVKLLKIVERDMADAGSVKSLESEALRVDERVISVLRDKSDAARKRFRWGMAALGVYMGIVVGGYLVRQSIYKRREVYDVDHTACVCCGRCYGYCPKIG